MARKTKDHRLEHSKGVRGEDRKRYFAQPGATAAGWRGGRKQVQKDRRKEHNKKACRGRVRW